MIAGLYRQGSSPLHRMRAGAKLGALIALGTLLLALPSPTLTIAGFLAVLLLFRLAGFGVSEPWRQTKPVLLVLALLFAAQLWIADPAGAVLTVLRLLTLILAAALVTTTTRMRDLVAVIEGALSPLDRFGVNAEKVSLAISLTLRFIPLVAQIVEEVKEAQAARGQDRSIVALAIPVVIRLLKTADAVAEAIDARDS